MQSEFRAAGMFPVLLTVVLAGAVPLPALSQAADGSAGPLLGTPATASVDPRPEPPLTALSHEIDTLFSRWNRFDTPGAAVLVMRDGDVLHGRGYGLANLEHGIPNRTTTVFDIASVSKQFAGMAILMLAEAGLVRLDDDVRLYLPELPDFGPTVRIRHLVHHTSGLRDWPGVLLMGGWDFMDVLSHEQILTMAWHQRHLNFAPGSEHAYSNTGYNLLAEIVARVSGVSFAEWTRENLFAPLGMTSTHFHDDHTAIVPNRAESYGPAARGGYRREVSNLTAVGSSSLFTTLDDLASWIRNLDVPAVGSAAVHARLQEPGVLDDGTPVPYAFGLDVGEYRGARTVSHTGAWAGYRSILLRFPQHGLTVAILANTNDVNLGLGYRIADLYLDSELAPLHVETGPRSTQRSAAAAVTRYRAATADLREYEGEYHSSELLTSYKLRLDGDVLFAEHFRIGVRPLQAIAPDVFASEIFGRVDFLRDLECAIEGFTASSARIRGVRFDRVR
jgi:CubicO group peptidase (beta-lactamase class C family)